MERRAIFTMGSSSIISILYMYYPFRPIVYFMIDVFSRAILAMSVSLDNNSILGITNLFLDMLNYDGITVVDNLGRIRAYNVFVKTDLSNTINIYGGARKRAVFSIVNSRKKKIIGVYFKSQEGEVFYQRVRK